MGAVTKIVDYVSDSVANLMSGLGVEGRDKSPSTVYGFRELTVDQLEAAFRGDWVARKGITIPADDATREWRQWEASDNQVEALEAEEQRLDIQRKTKRAKMMASLYGGAAIVVGVKGQLPTDELRVDTVGKDGIEFLHVVSRHRIKAEQIEADVTKPWYGQPVLYELPQATGKRVFVHRSRVIRFNGAELPENIALQTQDAMWGDSALQALDDAIKNCGLCAGGIATLVHEAKIDVIRVPDLMAQVGSDEYRSRMIRRFSLANVGKSTVNALLLDKDEEWARIQANFAGLPDVYKLYLLVACAAWDIPATRFLGQSAAGLNATGEFDLRNYYDNVAADQNNELAPTLRPLDEMVIRSALGNRPEEIHYIWRPLWQMDPKSKAEVDYTQAQTFQIDAQNSVMPVEVLRRARANQLVESGTYPGIEQLIDEHQKELDEAEEAAKEQFAAGGTEVQQQALNGAQISSLVEVVTAVVQSKLPPETGKAMLKVSFPNLEEDQIDEIIDPLESFEPTPDPVPLPFGGGGGGRLPPGQRAPANEEDDFRNRRAANDKQQETKDAEPRTLYIRRDVVNGSEIRAWMKAQGFERMMPLDQLHVTVCYSRTPVDWMKMGEDFMSGEITIGEGGPRIVEPLGDKGAVVLLFSSSQLAWRHEEIKRLGGSSDYPDYQPHITLTYQRGDIDLDAVEPYRGEIILGPEIFEEINDNFLDMITEIRP